MREFVGKSLLCAWVPAILAMAFPEISDGMYTIAGLMLFVFGTWGGILLIKD